MKSLRARMVARRVEETMKLDKLWHACQNALFVIDSLITDYAKDRYTLPKPHEERLTRVAEELRAALEYQEGINERLKP